jgi:nucleoside-diphosphate-sugar epimerase
MKVFVAGATGVLGHRTISRLVAAGADVTALVRSAERAARVEGLGARAAQASLFAAEPLAAAVAGHDVVVNLATAIPTGDRAVAPGAWDENDRIRREGARNLVDAALATGAGVYVQESISLLYADGGDEWLDEEAPIEGKATAGSSLEAEAQAARFAGQGGTGIVLRFAQLYGDDSGHTVDAIAAARAGQPVELGPEGAWRSVVTTDDAADAVLAVLGIGRGGAGGAAPSGIYNVADDEPLRRTENVAALAAALDVPVPVPATVQPDLPAVFSVMLRSQRVSNRRLKDATGWRPTHPSAREGWPFVVGEWRRRTEAP